MLTVREHQMRSMAEANKGRQMIAPCDGTKTWVEIRLVDEEDGSPVPGVKYRLELPDSSIVEGTLDAEGKARVESIVPGSCKLCFPETHGDDWRPL
jgi:hypothetical protein